MIYAAKCLKHQKIYVGHTGECLRDRFSKHRYDIKNRPDNSELARHFHDKHTLDDMKFTILQSDLERTFALDGINAGLGPYGKEMYESYRSMLSRH